MESIEEFKKKLNGYINKAYDNVALLNFLDEQEQAILIEELKYQSLNYKFEGGFINSQRNRCIISALDNIEDLNIVIFQIKYNKKFYEIGHRNVLGSLMSLGIKRECLGDICIIDNDIYFAVTKEISSFIMQEFNYVGKCPITLEIIDKKLEIKEEYKEKTCFLASLRLDTVVANALNLSRSESLEMIKEGLVYVNHLLNQNSSAIVKENDSISVRHKGKFKILSIDGKTKSDRTVVTIGILK